MKKLFFILLVSSGVLINADITDKENETIKNLDAEVSDFVENGRVPANDGNGNTFLHRVFEAALNAQDNSGVDRCAVFELIFSKKFRRSETRRKQLETVNKEGYNLRGKVHTTIRDICDKNNSRYYNERKCYNAIRFINLTGEEVDQSQEEAHAGAIYPGQEPKLAAGEQA